MVSVTNPKPTSHPTADTDVFKSRLDGDTNDRFIINADGKIEWGKGSEPVDSSFVYDGSNRDLRIGSSNKILFYGGHATESVVLRRTVKVGNEQPASSVPLTVKGAASQTADLQQWQDSAGNVKAHVKFDGRINIDTPSQGGIVITTSGNNRAAIGTDGLKYYTSALEQTTIGAAGTASALPSAPTKYLRVVDSAGNILAIPAYASA